MSSDVGDAGRGVLERPRGLVVRVHPQVRGSSWSREAASSRAATTALTGETGRHSPFGPVRIRCLRDMTPRIRTTHNRGQLRAAMTRVRVARPSTGRGQRCRAEIHQPSGQTAAPPQRVETKRNKTRPLPLPMFRISTQGDVRQNSPVGDAGLLHRQPWLRLALRLLRTGCGPSADHQVRSWPRIGLVGTTSR